MSAQTLTQLTPQTDQPTHLIDLHKADLEKIERIKKEVGQPNDDNLHNPVPLFNQIARAS